VLASAHGTDRFDCIDRHMIWEARNIQWYDEGNDLQADLDGLGNMIPNRQVSANITGQRNEQQ
jgi:hypothetical protein